MLPTHYSLAVLAALLTQFAVSSAFAAGASMTWDANSGSAGAQDGSGTWQTAAGNWRNVTSSTDNQNWVNANADFATFGAGSDGTYAITLGGAVTTGSGTYASPGLNFANSGYTLSAGSPLAVTVGTASGAFASVAAGKTATIGNNVTLTKASSTTGWSLGGGGTLEIATGGALTYANATPGASEVTGGTTLRINGGSATFASSLVVGKLNNGLSGNLTVDSGSLTVGGAGNLILGRNAGDISVATLNSGTISVAVNLVFGAGDATAAGTFHLNGGTLAVKSVTDIGAAVSTFNFNGGTLKAQTSATVATFMTGLDKAQIRNSAAIIDPNGQALVIGQALLHSTITTPTPDNATDGGLTVNDSAVTKGSLSLTSSGNTYTGPTTVTAGTLKIGTVNTLPTGTTVTLGGSGTIGALDLAGVNQQVASIAVGSGATASSQSIGNSSTTADSQLTLTGNSSFGGVIKNVLGSGTRKVSLVYNGSGNTLTLSGVSTYTGTTTISAGTLALGVGGSINNTPSISIAAGATFDVSALASPYTWSSSTTVSASGTGTGAATQASLKGASGGIVNLGSQGITLTWGGGTSGTQTTTPCMVISQGALTLSGNAITINGASTLGDGTYRLIQIGNGSSANTTTGTPSASATGTAIDGTKSNIISVDGSGNIILTVSSYNAAKDADLTALVLSPAGTLSPTFANTITTYTSTEAVGATPTVTATKSSPASATLELIVNGVSKGALTSGAASSAQTLTTGSAANTITVRVTSSDTTVVKDYTVTVTVPSGTPYYWDGNDSTAGFGSASGTWANPTAGTTSSGWSIDSTGAATVNGNSVLTGTGDALNFGGASAGLSAGTITVSSTVNANSLTFGAASGAVILSGGTISLQSGAINANNDGNIINSTISLGAAANIVGPNVNGGTLTLGGAINGNQNVGFRGQINSAGQNATTILNAQSGYTGTTLISTTSGSGTFQNETVRLGIDDALPTGTALTVSHGGTGSGSTVSWGQLDLYGHNQTVASIAAGSALNSQMGIINSSGTLGTLTVNNATADSFAGQLGYYGGPYTPAALGAGGNSSNLGLTKNGAGTLTLNPARYNNYFTGPTIINQGTLEFAGGAQLAYGNAYPGTINIAGGATLLFSGTAANPLGGAISGSGNLSITGAGTVSLSAANTYSGATTVSAGTLKLTAGSLGNTAVTLSGTGTFAVQPGSATTISAGNTGTVGAGGSLNLGAKTFDMTDSAVSTFNLVQESTFAGAALTLTSGATLKFNLGNSGADLLAVTKAASVSGTVNVTLDTTLMTAPVTGTYNLITAASGLTTGSPTWQFTGGGTTQNVTVNGSSYTLNLLTSDTAISVQVVATTASQLVFTTQPSASTVAGVAFAQQPVVKIEDQYGNVVTSGADATVNVALTLTTGAGTLGGTANMNAVAGVADFTGQGLNINFFGSDKVLTATATVTAGAKTTTTSPAFAITPATPSITLISSLNPAGYHDNLTFTATNLPTDASSNVVFTANGVAFSTNDLSNGGTVSLAITNLPRATTNIIAATYAGDNKYYSASASLTQTITNHPPVVNAASYTRNAVIQQIKIAVTNLLSNTTDVDGDTLTLASVSATTNTATLIVSGGWLLYNNTNAVNDEFTYTVSDGFGGTNSATVTINVDSTPLFGQSQLASTSGGTATLNFAGIPNYSYSVMRSTNLISSWTAVWTTNAPASGVFQFIDLAAPQPSAYYQLRYNP